MYGLGMRGMAKVECFCHYDGMPKPKTKQQSKRNPADPHLLARSEGKAAFGSSAIAPKKPLNKAPRTRKSKS